MFNNNSHSTLLHSSRTATNNLHQFLLPINLTTVSVTSAQQSFKFMAVCSPVICCYYVAGITVMLVSSNFVINKWFEFNFLLWIICKNCVGFILDLEPFCFDCWFWTCIIQFFYESALLLRLYAYCCLFCCGEIKYEHFARSA